VWRVKTRATARGYIKIRQNRTKHEVTKNYSLKGKLVWRVKTRATAKGYIKICQNRTKT